MPPDGVFRSVSNPEPLLLPHSLLPLARSRTAPGDGLCHGAEDAHGGFPTRAIARLRRTGLLAALRHERRRPAPLARGAPLRLRVERQLGYKSLKYLASIEATDRVDGLGQGRGSMVSEMGFSWYAGI